jgi:hypothetical protein
MCGRGKSEGRNPKAEGSPKSELRNPKSGKLHVLGSKLPVLGKSADFAFGTPFLDSKTSNWSC